MRPIFLIYVGLILITSRKNNKTTSDLEPKINSVTKVDHTEIIIQKILNLPDEQWMLHTEMAGRLPIKIIENNHADKNLSLKKFN